MTACDKDANLISKQYDIPSELELYYLTLECGCAGEDEAAAFLPADACCCDTGSADVLVRSGSERGRSRSHVECLFSSVTHQGVTGQSLMSRDGRHGIVSVPISERSEDHDRHTGSMHQVEWIGVDDVYHADDSGWTVLKSFEYYPSNDTHDQKGLLKKETVPDIEGTTDKVTEYEYWKDLGGSQWKLENGPTRTKYQWWNGTSYETKTSTTAYDAGGRVVSSTDADSRTIGYEYDNKGRQVKTIYVRDSAGNPTIYTENVYDCCHLQKSRDENGNYTHYTYDAAGRVSKTWTDIQSIGDETSTPLVEYVYDGFGNTWKVKTRTDDTSSPRETVYTYDALNRVTAIDHPGDLGTEEFGYDTPGSLVWKRDGSSAVTIYKYDNLNRLTDVWYNYTGSLTPITYPSGSGDVHYTYYGGSRLRATMVDSAGTSSYTYDMQGRLATYAPPAPSNRLVEYDYNTAGQKTSMILKNNGTAVLTLGYNYYANGALKSVLRNSTTVATYDYDAVDNRSRVELGNDTYTEYDYSPNDPRYSIDGIRYYDSGDSLLAQFDYTRDNAGNPLTIGSTEYTYDDNNRLASEDEINFDYDWVGNRNPGTWSYNSSDQLTATTQNQYIYLGTGSLQYAKDATGQTVQKSYAYTNTNLLQSIVHNDIAGTPSSSMLWDADDHRVSFTSSSGGTTQFVYDVTAQTPSVIEEILPSEGGSVFYIREPDGSLIARVSGTGESQSILYYHYDELGSTRLLTSGSGLTTDTYSYDSWGNVAHDSGNTQQPYQYVGQLGYYTHYQDANLSELQLGVRFYAPALSRFSQTDRVRKVGPDYTYTDNEPMDGVDPTGLLRWPPGQKEKCPNLPKAMLILQAALKKPSCSSYWQNIGCTLGRGNDPFPSGQGPRVIIADPRWSGWGPLDNGGTYGECGCNHHWGPRQGDILVNRELCHGNGRARALAATIAHESAHWCLCRAKRAGMPGVSPGKGDDIGKGEGYGAERACFGEVVY